MINIINDIKVKEQIALITGSCGNLGKEFTKTLAEMGYDLILTDLNTKSLKLLKNEIIKKYNLRVFYKACDLSSLKSRNDLTKFIKTKTKKIDLFVNNAGLTGIKEKNNFTKKNSIEFQSVENFTQYLEVNLSAVFHLTKNFSELLLKSKNGKIINIGSIYGSVAPRWEIYDNQKMNNRAGYSASKAGLLQLTKWFATYLAPNVRVNMISPGGVFRGHNKVFLKKYNSNVPLKKMANINDINGTLIYLASDLSRYVTGQNLFVDGGWTVT